MVYTWESIRLNWPSVVDLGYVPEEIVDAFNRRERYLGPASSRTLPPTIGTYVPLTIACHGRCLSAVDAVPNVGRFVSRLKRDDGGAWAELEALYLLRSGSAETEARIDPHVDVGARRRLSDSRIRRLGDDAWTYVEVTRPGESRSQRYIKDHLRTQLGGVAAGEARDVRLSLTRRPNAGELNDLRTAIANAEGDAEHLQIDLPWGLGSLEIDNERTGATSGLAMIRQVVPDSRGVQTLRREASQLPADSPSMVMIDVSDVLADWSPSLRAYFADGGHPWVSAVALFTSGFMPGPHGESWAISVRLIENPNAVIELPAWARDALGRFVPSGFDA